MNLQFSQIGQRLSGPSGIVELMDDLGAAMASGDMLMLGGGNPAMIPEVQEIWRQRLQQIAGDADQCVRLLAHYEGPAGNLRFRESFAASLREVYGWDVGPDNIAITNGGQTAYFFLFALLGGKMDSGDHRHIMFPLVPEYIGYADQALEPQMYRSFRPRIEELQGHTFKYRIDFDAIEVTEQTAAICVSRPTNPTGNVLTDDEISRLAAMAAERDIPLFVDNAYGEPYPGAVFEPIAPVWNRNMVMTFSLSKLGLPGTRTGIVLADEQIISRIRSMTCIVGLANNNVGQAIVEPLLASGELRRLSQQLIRPYYQAKSQAALGWVEQYFGDHFPYKVHRSEGSFFLWLCFPELPISTKELYARLKKRGVLIVPGEYFFFGCEGLQDWPHHRQCIRMTYSQSEAVVENGIQIIADELQRLHN